MSYSFEPPDTEHESVHSAGDPTGDLTELHQTLPQAKLKIAETLRPRQARKAKNRERILAASIDLFNQSGVVAVTTNHIAAHLEISPGNLYFHFRNREEIILELFERMCRDTYAVWSSNQQGAAYDSPVTLVERSFEVFWNYRFFHREMYHLRRRDPALGQRWKKHISKTVRLLNATYAHWTKTGVTRSIQDPAEMKMLSDVVLITSSSFLQFFESPEKPATRRSLRQGIDHILRFLLPYLVESQQAELRQQRNF
jgi:AcrR family transcriptional regulator